MVRSGDRLDPAEGFGFESASGHDDGNPRADDACTSGACSRVLGQPPLEPKAVTIVPALGNETVTVAKARLVCFPSTKNGVASALNINDYECYAAKADKGAPKVLARDVMLVDQGTAASLFTGSRAGREAGTKPRLVAHRAAPKASQSAAAVRRQNRRLNGGRAFALM